MTSNGGFTRSTGDIELVNVAGDLLGDVRSLDGSIVEVAVQGDIGTSSAAADITATEGIGSITCEDLFAHVDGAYGFTAPKDISTIIVNGDVGANATVRLNQFSSFDIFGDLAGTVTFPNGMHEDGVLNIGDSFSGDINMSPEDGLKGRIVINRRNISGTWTGTVRIRTVSLASPTYSNSAASLGGGSSGLVPFTRHESDSFPAHNSNVSVANAPSPTNPALVRYYGEVSLQGSQPVYICRRGKGLATCYEVTDCFDVAVSAADSAVLEVKPSAALPNGAEFAIVNLPTGSDRVDCVTGLPSPPRVASGQIYFGIGNSCAADLNGDGHVDNDDLAIIHANNGLSGCFQAGDVDGDGSCDSADMNLWFSQVGADCE